MVQNIDQTKPTHTGLTNTTNTQNFFLQFTSVPTGLGRQQSSFSVKIFVCQKQRDGRAQVLTENLLKKDTVKTFYQKNRYQNVVSEEKKKVLSKHLIRKSHFFKAFLKAFFLFCVVSNFNILKTLTHLVHAGLFWCFHNPSNSDMDHRIFNQYVIFWHVCTH